MPQEGSPQRWEDKRDQTGWHVGCTPPRLQEKKPHHWGDKRRETRAARGYHAAPLSTPWTPRWGIKKFGRSGMWVACCLAGFWNNSAGVRGHRLKRGGVWVARHLTRLWLITGVNRPKRGGVWVSRRLARLRLIPYLLCFVLPPLSPP
jgi:hypothetical protein